MSKNRPRERGIALILVMLVLSLLIVLVSQFRYGVTVDAKVARNSTDDVKAFYAANGAVAWVKAWLREDRANTKVDSRREAWSPEQSKLTSVQVGDTAVRLTVEDVERRFNVNLCALPATAKYARGVLSRLATHLGIDKPQEVADGIAGYILGTLDGKAVANAKSAPLDSVEELLLVDTIPIEALIGKPASGDTAAAKGLLEFLTVYGAGKVNINTAPAELLWALPPEQAGGKPIDASARDSAVQEIEDYRTGTSTTGTGTTGATGTTGTTGTTSADGPEGPPGQDFESVDKLGQVAKELQPAMGASINQAQPGGTTAGGTGTPGTSPGISTAGGAGAVRNMAFRDMLTVTALDFRIDMHVAAGTPAPTIGGSTQNASNNSSGVPYTTGNMAGVPRGAPDRRFLVILRRGAEQFDILSWREVAQ